MCGFVSYDDRTLFDNDTWLAKLTLIAQQIRELRCFTAYPAFGNDVSRRIPLIIAEEGQAKLVEATWWFDASVDAQGKTQLGQRTSFNARNLDSPFWRAALKHHRAVVFASSIGESKLVGKTKHQYLMQSLQAFLLGAVYRKLPNGDYVCAIITRDAHEKMAPYHDKAFPLFLPHHNAFLEDWLINTGDVPLSVQTLLASPKLFPNLHVQRVKSYKSGQPMGGVSDSLMSDEPALLN